MPKRTDDKSVLAPPSTERTPSKSRRKSVTIIPRVDPDAAGADIGAREIVVCVPADRDDQPVRTFATFTQDLHDLANWLVACRIKTIAMESTGMYWIPLFQILEARGIDVRLVNARHVKNVPGRKSDVSDCQWLQYLHSVGLLRGSFRPPQDICAIRSLARHRESLLAQAADQVRHMHKCLDQMNLQIHHVINDLTGATGMAIIEAIVQGERDARKLAAHRDRRIKASAQTVEKSLRGDWREEHLLVLRLALKGWQHLRAQIDELDTEIARRVRALDEHAAGAQTQPEAPAPTKKRLNFSANAPAESEALRQEFHRVLGTDLTQVPAISVLTVQSFISEVGSSLNRFKSAKHFSSWLGLCPGTKISGGKVLDARSRRGKPRFALQLRQAAQSLHSSRGALGARYRRLRSRQGAPKALTAMAHCLARIIYKLVSEHRAYDDSIFAALEAEHDQRQHQRLQRQASNLGYTLIPATPI
jgi:transposase